MYCIIRRKWGVITLLLHSLRIVCPQIPVFPFFLPPPPIQVIQVQIPVTTTTTPRPQIQAIAAMPLPVPMHVGVPMPIFPQPRGFGPGPVIVPFPPVRRRRPQCRVRRCRRPRIVTDTSSDDSSSSDSVFKRRKKRRRRRLYRNHRRNLKQKHAISDSEIVKPVLSYLDNRGDAKMKKSLTNDEAAELLKDKGSSSDQDPRRSLKVSDLTFDEGPWPKLASDTRRKQVVLRSGLTSRVLGSGRKKLKFKPPGDKKITNLSVSFQVV